jgi:hypothetical protein
MSDAFYYQGLTIEYDSSDPHLTIDGQGIKIVHEDGFYRAAELANVKEEALLPLGQAIIEHSPGYKKRKKVKAAHLAILKEGVNRWNEWRRENPEIRPILYEADLKKETCVAKLELPNFSNANLINSDFRGMELVEPNFHEANLGGAKLCHAILTSANFCRTDLYETDLSDATLTKANLQGTQLAKTIFERATLKDCKIYGLSAWDLNLKEAKQENHIIRYRYQSEGQYADVSKEAQITVEDLQVAQFVYLFLDNKNIRNVIDTMTSKVVLILGRFTDERKKVLDAIRSVLPQMDLTPIVLTSRFPRTAM